MTLSDSQKKVLKKAFWQTLRELRSDQAAAEKWGDPAPSIYNVRIVGLTPKKSQIFLRHGLIEHRGNDPSYDQWVATSAFGRSYRAERVDGEARFFWTREGLGTVKRLLEAKKPRGNPMTYKVEVKKNGQRYGEFGPYKRKSDADADAKALRQKGPDVRVSVVRSNPGHQWIQEVQEEIEEDGTAGRFTAQARRAGYDSPTAFAEKIMHEWRAGRERVWNKREKRWQKVTTMTMRRANYLLNTRHRRNG